MTTMTFDAVAEAQPGPRWQARWRRSWPEYEAWFRARGGDAGPDARACRAALRHHMPELVPVYDRLVQLTGGGDRPARFLSTWCPPAYLGGCSLAAKAEGAEVRLVRNYDLAPDLNEGLLLRSEWTGRPVMGMVEFLWGLSDGINDAGLSVALAYGGSPKTARGFGITTILRYVLETCETVEQAVAVLGRVPSHMEYNVVLADRLGRTAGVEVQAGGGARRTAQAIAANHQHGSRPPRAAFSRTYERHAHLAGLDAAPADLARHFTEAPLRQDRFGEGFGTLFTAEYDPVRRALRLIWPAEDWRQSLDGFEEGRRLVTLTAPAPRAIRVPRAPAAPPPTATAWAMAVHVDWHAVGRDYAEGRGRPLEAYLAEACARHSRQDACRGRH